MPFHERAQALPRLGFGISTEHGAAEIGTSPLALRRARPDLVDFLEIGADVARGVDPHTEAWVRAGLPTTYHFLDVNLEEPEDLDEEWLRATVALARATNAAWLCGDAGLWHVGPRDYGHGTLLPPILCASSLSSMVEAVIALRERSGFEVLPENPPAQVLVGDLDPLTYFGALAEQADCGLLVDVAHLAITQRALGLAPTALLDAFPADRIVEVHVAGGTAYDLDGRTLIHDDHGPRVHDDTWLILEELVKRATSLKAVVVEGERNSLEDVVALFEAVRARVSPIEPRARPVQPRVPPGGEAIDHRRAQRTLFRMFLDPGFAERIRAEGAPELGPAASAWLQGLDPRLVAADPGDVRLRQLLGNVVLEFVHTARAAPQIVAPFARSPELHDAIAHDRPLPLAFARYAARVLPPDPLPRALLALDAAMAELRRSGDAPPPATPALAPTCRLVDLPEGTVSAASAIREERSPAPLGGAREHVLLIGGPRGSDGRRSVQVEVLSAPIAELLAAGPLTGDVRAAFAARHDASLQDVDELIDGLRADGIVAP